MVHTVRCIKFGDVMLDENRRPFMLCNTCHMEFSVLRDFRVHLDSCKAVQHLFKKETTYAFEDQKGVKLLAANGAREYFVHNYKEVIAVCNNRQLNIKQQSDSVLDLISLEKELQDPRWYVNLEEQQNDKKQMEQLRAAVQPYVQFKENNKTNNSGNKKPMAAEAVPQYGKRNSVTVAKVKPTIAAAAKETYIIKQTQAKQFTHNQTQQQTSATAAAVGKPKLLNPTMSSCSKPLFHKINTDESEIMLVPRVDPTPTPAVMRMPQLVAASKPKLINNIQIAPATKQPTEVTATNAVNKAQTAEILSKLQNRGLQVKRHSVVKSAPTATTQPVGNGPAVEAMLRKLQSNGINCKLKSTTANAQQKPAKSTVSEPLAKRMKPMNTNNRSSSSNNTTIGFNSKNALNIANKSLIIRKIT